MEGWVGPGDGARVMFVPSQHIVELGALDVGFVVEDISLGLGGSKEEAVGAKSNHIPIDLMIASNPHMSVSG
jgi:hypothetical protein